MKYLLIKFLIMTSFVLYAQQSELAWDYPVKPGMEQWKKFKSVDEMYQACQIPVNFLKQLDTESLVEICLNFPAPPLFPIFNTPKHAFMEFYSNFNGIRELFERRDAGRYLLKKYSEMSLSEFNPQWPLYRQGQFISHYKFIESILSQTQILTSLGSVGRNSLLKESIRKMDEKISKNDLFSGFSLEINLWMIGNLLYSENRSLLQGYDDEALQTAIETGMFVDIDVDRLYQQAKKYAHENE